MVIVEVVVVAVIVEVVVVAAVIVVEAYSDLASLLCAQSTSEWDARPRSESSDSLKNNNDISLTPVIAHPLEKKVGGGKKLIGVIQALLPTSL